MSPTIGLLGDLMLGRGVGAHRGRSASDLWSSELRALAAECDLLVANLECCISERGHPTELVAGKPFFFRAPPAAVEWLRAMRVDVAGLANNHALDFGERALADTLHYLEEAGIAATGAGHRREHARHGAVVEGGGVRLGVAAVSDHPRQFAAGPEGWGIAHGDLESGVPAWLETELRRLREECDLVIAFPHWGPNLTVRPAPWQCRCGRELLAAGADLVAGHSAHVFHGIERRAGGLLLYDLGDAVDDYVVDPKLRNDLGLMARWSPGESPELELIGLRIEERRTRVASGGDAEWIAARLAHACAELGAHVERAGEARFSIP